MNIITGWRSIEWNVKHHFPPDYYQRKDGYHRVYVLKLQDDRYYVGVTKTDVRKRFELHMRGISSAMWTRKYRPIKILEIIELGFTNYTEAVRRENLVTMDYIGRYGLSAVRGGIICSLDEKVAAKWLRYAHRRYRIILPMQELVLSSLVEQIAEPINPGVTHPDKPA